MGTWVSTYISPMEYDRQEHYIRCWEQRQEFGVVFTIVRKTLLSGRVRIIIADTTIAGGKEYRNSPSTW